MDKKEAIVQWLKDLLKKEVIKKVLGSAAGGLKLFLLITAFNWLWKKYLGPSVRFVWRKIKSYFQKIKYKKQAQRLDNAKTEDEFNSAADDMP